MAVRERRVRLQWARDCFRRARLADAIGNKPTAEYFDRIAWVHLFAACGLPV